MSRRTWRRPPFCIQFRMPEHCSILQEGCPDVKELKIMTNRALSVLIAGALSVVPVLYGQVDDPAQKKEPQQNEQADRVGQQTLTGCLTEEQGTFQLATSTGEQ